MGELAANRGRRRTQAGRREQTLAGLGLLTIVALVLRRAVDVEGALDTDTINFGLAALRFDVLDHQPHPPGYPGYVLFLKLIHAVAPSLGPLEIAKWGSRLCGAATVPAAFWACRQLVPGASLRPLLAAAFATLHPVLWYYGGDGQAHAAEALVSVLLVGFAAWAVPRPLGSALLAVAVFGLAGAVRPTVPLLCSPLLVWVFWRRPLRAWLWAVVVGAASVLAWAGPLVVLSGGWDLYRRASRALFGELFFASYSVFGARATTARVTGNLAVTAWSLGLAVLPALAWSRWRASPGTASRSARRALLAIGGVSILFFGLVYIAEVGYMSGVAAVACLTPATWPRVPGPELRLRGAAVLALAPAVLLLGPAGLPLPGGGAIFAPTLGHVAGVDLAEAHYRRIVCDAAGGEPTLALTDNPVTTHTRLLPLQCPGVLVGLHVGGIPLHPGLDNWLVFDALSMTSLPTEVPLEVAPPAVGVLPRAVRRVVVAPDASPALGRQIAEGSTCAGTVIDEVEAELPSEVTIYPAECLREIRVGRNVLRLLPG